MPIFPHIDVNLLREDPYLWWGYLITGIMFSMIMIGGGCYKLWQLNKRPKIPY